MKFLVTGAGGYIGSHLIQNLQERNEDFLALTGISASSRSRLTYLQCRSISVNLLDAPQVESIVSDYKPEFVIHLASLKSSSESNTNPELYLRNNLHSLKNIFESSKKAGARVFINASSSSVYGDLSVSSIREADKGQPLSYYGISKKNAEEFLESSNDNALSCVSIRMFNVIGALKPQLRDLSDAHLIPATLNRLSRGLPALLFGANFATPDGSAIRDYIHVTDVVRIINLLEDYLLSGGEGSKSHFAINVGSEKGTSVIEFFEQLKLVLRQSFEVITLEARSGDPAKVVSNNDTLRRLLGFSPKQTFEEMILTCI